MNSWHWGAYRYLTCRLNVCCQSPTATCPAALQSSCTLAPWLPWSSRSRRLCFARIVTGHGSAAQAQTACIGGETEPHVSAASCPASIPRRRVNCGPRHEVSASSWHWVSCLTAAEAWLLGLSRPALVGPMRVPYALVYGGVARATLGAHACFNNSPTRFEWPSDVLSRRLWPSLSAMRK